MIKFQSSARRSMLGGGYYAANHLRASQSACAQSTIPLYGVYKLLLLVLLLLILSSSSSGGDTNTILNSIKIHTFIPIHSSNTWQILLLSSSISTAMDL